MNQGVKDAALVILAGMVANPNIVESGDEDSLHKVKRLVNSAYGLAAMFEQGPQVIDEED